MNRLVTLALSGGRAAADANHNIIDGGGVPLKPSTLYAPPNQRDGVVHHTRADAESDNEQFDSKTTE